MIIWLATIESSIKLITIINCEDITKLSNPPANLVWMFTYGKYIVGNFLISKGVWFWV